MSDDSAANAPAPAAEAAAPTVTDSAPKVDAPEVAKTDATEPVATEQKDDKKPEEAANEKKDAEDTAESGAKPKGDDDVEMKDATTTIPTKEHAPTQSSIGQSSGEVEKPADDKEDADKEQKQDEATTTLRGGDATPADKNKNRRKSAGGATTKKLNKKASKAKLTNLDAEPGNYYFHKLKGHPQWPVIICSEDMLPQPLIQNRPVSAARPDGTYREDHADGGKRMSDRTFPVMYLHTNEFAWVKNTEMVPLDTSTVMESMKDSMKLNLKAAYEVASQAHPLDYFKDILQQFQEDLAEKAKALVEAVTTPKKSAKKAKAADAADEDEDMDMPDADEDEEAEKPKKSKKRKAEDEAAPPQESAKKTKIKITSNSTPKAANGAATPKAAKSAEPKSAKSKTKAKAKPEEKKAEVQQKEPELSAEEKHQRKEKEVLFLRHKLQKGLLARDEEPKEEEMQTMSDYITKLETFPDLEVDIIRKTKINKVLKAILKLGSIPKEAEHKFKERSQKLLDLWNKLLADESGNANGVNGKAAEKSAEPEASKDEAAKSEKTNGTKTNGVAEEKESKDSEPPKASAEPEKAPEAVEAAA